MDLNLLYSQHQLALMQAANSASPLARTKFIAAAGLAAFRIQKYQSCHGARAADGWMRSMTRTSLGQPS